MRCSVWCYRHCPQIIDYFAVDSSVDLTVSKRSKLKRFNGHKKNIFNNYTTLQLAVCLRKIFGHLLLRPFLLVIVRKDLQSSSRLIRILKFLHDQISCYSCCIPYTYGNFLRKGLLARLDLFESQFKVEESSVFFSKTTRSVAALIESKNIQSVHRQFLNCNESSQLWQRK